MRIVMDVKRVQFQRVVFDSENGYDVPGEINELLKFCEEVKDSPLDYTKEEDWTNAEEFGQYSIESFEVQVNETTKL